MASVKKDQVGVDLQHPPVGSLSLWERVRVRGFSLTQQKRDRSPRSLFLCHLRLTQILAQQRVIQLAVAQNPHDMIVIVQHQFVASLITNLQRIAHADARVH
ncbi:Uncharacterised protein [Pseudomonas fluorescens]|uniref:Uncharacterized protein n=1 Tax=Pseudomonas fluorescens TaxID=294 RepID=A0A3S4R9S3_PSEFL|nr:Uncharacterised protein [Pseudomonas fluorescens]